MQAMLSLWGDCRKTFYPDGVFLLWTSAGRHDQPGFGYMNFSYPYRQADFISSHSKDLKHGLNGEQDK
jgi:hypothetical protein